MKNTLKLACISKWETNVLTAMLVLLGCEGSGLIMRKSNPQIGSSISTRWYYTAAATTTQEGKDSLGQL